LIGIKVNNDFLDFDGAITITLINPIFDVEKIQRTFSYLITIKNTPKNKKLLGFIDRLDGQPTRRISGVDLYLDNIFFERGVIRVVSSSPDRIKASFESEALDYVKTVESQSLRSLTMPQDATFNFCFSAQFQATNIQNNGKRLKIGINGQVFARLYPERNLIVDDINAAFPGIAALISWDVRWWELL